MATAPYGVRLLVGAAVTALEETRKLPHTILTYPMTMASQVAHIVMKMQQDVADLVDRGDQALDTLFPPKDEQAEWATFDEDLNADDADFAGVTDISDAGERRDGERLTEGRFALYSTGEPGKSDSGRPTVTSTEAPTVAAELDYQSLTLAQLRARLPSLRVNDLEALLAYEESTTARAPFQTLLANRITRASAK
ncbi:MAG TPA: lipid droplet-associated protein [Mycobacterium sp.]|nr:lipid droplet-associated protein [Mycobacterium sp.]